MFVNEQNHGLSYIIIICTMDFTHQLVYQFYEQLHCVSAEYKHLVGILEISLDKIVYFGFDILALSIKMI